jgi:hypothetical protein
MADRIEDYAIVGDMQSVALVANPLELSGRREQGAAERARVRASRRLSYEKLDS